MRTVLDKNVLQRIFEESSDLETILVQGDLANYDAWLIVPDNISVDDVMHFIDYNLDTDLNSDCSTMVLNLGYVHEYSYVREEFVECKREDYVWVLNVP